ncbi:MAG: ethylbenzene dehydrogenase-related protein [Rhodothermales bacterium]
MILRTAFSLFVAGALAAPAFAQNTTLVVQPGAPVLDGVVSEGEWTSTPLVTARGVTLNAMADGEFLYVAASWADETENARHNLLSYTGTRWTKAEDEDRIAFLFDMGQTGSDGANCQAFCHFPGMNTNGGTVDVWQWRAARSNPMGYAVDTHWDETGQFSDDGVTAALLNDLNQDTRLPGFMATADPGAIAAFLVENAEALAGFDPYDTLGEPKVEEAVAFDAAATFSMNDQIPGNVLRVPSGDVADVRAAGKYDNGVWTVEFKRAFAGSDKDFQVVPGASVEFMHELFDNQGGDHAIDATLVDPTIYTMDFSMISGVAIEPVTDLLPRRTALHQNYPNPFNGATEIEIDIASPDRARLDVLDIHGRVVRTLLNESVAPGHYRIPFDSQHLASGMYFYRLTTGATSETRHMVLVR